MLKTKARGGAVAALLEYAEEMTQLTGSPDAQASRSNLREAAAHVLPLSPSPQIGIVLGSGLSPLADTLHAPSRIPYSAIPHMPSSAVEGHRGELLLGTLGEAPVACLSGRAHLYEGHSPAEVVFGVRLLAELGVRWVLLTNAAGGISGACQPGTLMLITDHINLTGTNPLVGPWNRDDSPFVDMSVAYDLDLRQKAKMASKRLGLELAEGVYAGLLGPTFETPAEIRMLEQLGASAVGMSTVLETIALRHRDVPVLGISCITNRAAGKSSTALSHEEVAEVAGRTSDAFCRLVFELCQPR